jgi:hypothetical protein
VACKLYPLDQFEADGVTLKDDAVGIDLSDIEAVQRFLLENADKIDPEMLGVKSKAQVLEEKARSGGQDIQKTIDKALNSALDTDVKRGVADALVYETLSNKQQRAVIDELSEELGSTDNIIDAANSLAMFPWQRVLLYNVGLEQLAEQSKGLTGKAKEANTKQQIETLLALKDAASSFAKGLQAMQVVYNSPASPIAIQMVAEADIEQANKTVKKKGKKAAKEVLDEMNKDYTAGDVIDEVAETLTGETDIKKEEEKIKVTKQNIAKERKGTKKNPISVLNSTKKKGGTLGAAYDTLNEVAKQSLLPQNVQSALNSVVRGMIDEGVTSVADIANAINKKWKGKFSEGIEEAYNNAREELQSENSPIELDSIEETQRATDEIKQAAKDLVDASARITAEKLAERARKKAANKQIQADAKENQSENANVIIAEKLLRDIQNLANPELKREQSLVKQVAAAYQAKVRELLGIKSEGKTKTADQILKDKTAFASEKTWEDIRKSVIAAIDNDKTLTKVDKEYLKDDFLAHYIDNGIKTLLTGTDVKKILGKAGNWRDIIKNEDTVDKAKEKLRGFVEGITDNPAVAEQINKAFDDAVKTKRVEAIKRTIKAKSNTKAKSKVVKAVDKMAAMVAQGGLDIDGIFDVLSDEFGIISLDADQKAQLKILSENLYNAPKNSFLKDNARHKIAAFVNDIVLNNWAKFLQNAEALSVINLFTPETLAVNFIGSGFEWLDTLDLDTFRNNKAIDGLTKAELAKAYAAFVTIMKGGSAYIESYTESIDKMSDSGSGSKEHTLNSLESKSGGRLLGVVPEIWATVDGTMVDLNLFNYAQKTVRGIGRTMNAGDAFFMVGINNKAAFNIRQNQLILQGVSKPMAANQARTEVYGGDMVAAKEQAAREIARSGEKLTDANITRRAAEILRGEMPNEVNVLAEQITMEQTFKAATPNDFVGTIARLALNTPPDLIRLIVYGNPRVGKSLAWGLANSDNPSVAAATKSLVNILTKWVMPFTSGISNLAERAAEMVLPYAALKAGLNYAKQQGGKDYSIGGVDLWVSAKTDAEIAAFQVRNQLLLRKAIKGTAVILPLLIAALGDDDDDVQIYGNGEIEFTGKKAANLKYKRVVVINGVAIPFKAFPDMEPILNAYGAIADMKRAGIDVSAAQQSAIITSAYFDTGYMEGVTRLKKLATGDANYTQKTTVNGLVNSIVPLVGVMRWTQRNFTDPYQKDLQNLGLLDQLKYYSGLNVDERYNVTDWDGNLVKIAYEYPNLTSMNADFKKQYDKNVTPSYKLLQKANFQMTEPKQTDLFFDENKSELFSKDQTVQYKGFMKETFKNVRENSYKANEGDWKAAPPNVVLKYADDIEQYSKSVAELLMLVEYKKPISKALKETVYKAGGENAKVKPLFFFLPQKTKDKIMSVTPEAKPKGGTYRIGATEITTE